MMKYESSMIHSLLVHNKGFTLLETLLYIGLLAILIGGILVSVYPIFTNTGRSSLQVTTDTEAGFLVRKLAWALSSIDAITEPNLGDTGAVLTIDTISEGILSFSESGGNVMLSKSGGGNEPLLSSRVEIENLLFTYEDGASGAPDAILIEFDINGDHVGPIRRNVR